MAVVIQGAEGYLGYGLVDGTAGGLLHRQLVVCNGVGGVAAREVEIADGIVYLVEIFFVAVVAGHAFESLHFGHYVCAGKYLALLDAGVELGAVARARTSGGFLECLVGLLLIARKGVYLPKKKVQARFLGFRGKLYSLREHRDGFLILLLFHQQVGVGGVVERAYLFRCQLVGLYARQDVFGLEKPVEGAVAACLP